MTAPASPRLLTPAQAMEYLGLTCTSTFADWRRRQIIPDPIPGTKMYDLHAINRRLDELSGLSDSTPRDPYEEWKAGLENARGP